MKLRLTVWVMVGIVLVATGPILAQGPETYAVSHLFALPTATTTRLFGMGGFVTCIKDAGFANPAFAGTLQGPDVVGRVSLTDFDCGLDLQASQLSVAVPLSTNRRGLQVTYLRLDSDPGVIPGPLQVDLSEQDMAIHYGHRLSENWILGVGVSPIFKSTTNLRNPGTGTLIGRLDSSSDRGCRLGGLYELTPESWLGFVYDYYNEDVTATGPAFGSGFTASFNSREIAVGFSGRVNESVLGAVEWQQMSTKGAGVSLGDAGFRVGFEAQVAKDWAVRAGSNDGALCGGVGFAGTRWSLEYAYMSNWNEDSVGAVLGDSHTHQVEARYQW